MTIDALFESTIRRVIREELKTIAEEFRGGASPAASSPGTRLTTEQVAAQLGGGVAAKTIAAWCKSGDLKATKLGNRYLIRLCDLERFLAEHPAEAAPSAGDQPPSVDDQVVRIMGRLPKRGGQ